MLRGYLSPREGTVIAARLAGIGNGRHSHAERAVHHPGLGRPDLRCSAASIPIARFDTGRFAGEHVLFGNLEVRHDLLAFGDLGAITLLGFVDAGRVFEGEKFS